MTTPPAAVLKFIEQLDDDFQVFWSRTSPPSKALIDAAEKRLGAKLRDDHRALVRTMGAGAVLAKEEVWPRAKELDVRPLWQFLHGVEIFGVAPQGNAPVVDVVVQSKERAPDADGVFVAAIRRIGDRRCVGYDKKGRLFEWSPGQTPEDVDAPDLTGVLLAWLKTLADDKERMKREARGAKSAKSTKSAKGEPSTESSASAVDQWLERLASDRRGEAEEAFKKAPKSVRDGVVARILDATAGKKPDLDMIWQLGKVGNDPRAAARIIELARHASASVREIAVDLLDCVEALPKERARALAAALDDKSEEVRSSAAGGLASAPSADAVEPLLAAIARAKKKRDVSGVFFANLLEALGACGAGRADVVDLLVAHIGSAKSRYDALPAYKALGAMGAKGKRAIVGLEKLLAHDDPYHEMHARHALALITGDPKPHLARLRAGTKIKDAGNATAASAQIALREIEQKLAKAKKR